MKSPVLQQVIPQQPSQSPERREMPRKRWCKASSVANAPSTAVGQHKGRRDWILMRWLKKIFTNAYFVLLIRKPFVMGHTVFNISKHVPCTPHPGQACWKHMQVRSLSTFTTVSTSAFTFPTIPASQRTWKTELATNKLLNYKVTNLKKENPEPWSDPIAKQWSKSGSRFS